MTIFCGLIAGRHDLPDQVSDYVYSSNIPHTHICDSCYMDDVCDDFLDRHIGTEKICVYITGFTPALLALIKACTRRNIHLTAYHYDRDSHKYWEQEVI